MEWMDVGWKLRCHTDAMAFVFFKTIIPYYCARAQSLSMYIIYLVKSEYSLLNE